MFPSNSISRAVVFSSPAHFLETRPKGNNAKQDPLDDGGSRVTSSTSQSAMANPGDEQQSTTTTQQDHASALHSNIKTKGQNSYYYAHKKREDVEIHEWDGKAAPRLLKTQSVDPNDVEVHEAITNYAWADGKKRVSVYITLPDIGAHPEEHTVIDWSGNSFSLKIRQYNGKTRVLVLKLYEDISDVKTKRKENQLVLMLTKASELRWHSLKKDS